MSAPLPLIDRLVVRPPNWLGDAVLALPAMTAVRRAFPAAHLAVAAPPAVAALFREDTGVEPDEVLELPSEARAIEDALARGQFELGVLFPNSFRSAWILRRAGIKERWGVARSARGWLLTRRGPRPGARCSSTRSAISGSTCRPSCCAPSRKGRSSGLAASNPSRPISASSSPPTWTSRRRSRTGASGKTSITAST
jgi:hypothetical protein